MWIFYALASRFLWSGCNAIDQVLSRAHAEDRMRAVLALQLACLAPFAAVSWVFAGSAAWGPDLVWLIGLATLFNVAALIPYYRAMQLDEAYNVIPFFEFTPLFLILLAYVFKHEILSPEQWTGAGLVILGGFLFSWDFRHSRVRWRILALVSLSAFLFALYQFIISAAGRRFDLWQVSACFMSGQCLVGLALLGGFGRARAVVLATARATKGATVLLALATNALSFLAFLSLVTAFARAPTVGHVAALSGTQPVFSFLLAVPLGRCFPRHFERLALSRENAYKAALIVLIFAGVYVLSS